MPTPDPQPQSTSNFTFLNGSFSPFGGWLHHGDVSLGPNTATLIDECPIIHQEHKEWKGRRTGRSCQC